MHDQTEHTLLAELAERAGIAADYYDIAGNLHRTSDDTRRAILTAMGFAVDSTASLTEALQEWEEAPWQRPCDPVRILRDGETGAPLSCYLTLDEGQEESVEMEWQIHDEANAVAQEGQAGPGLSAAEVRFLKCQRHVRIEIPAPQGLSLGYYNLTVQAKGLVGGSAGSMRVIVAPRQCYAPPSIEAHQRLWGLALQLYSLSSNRNWGCGDFTDLGRIVEWAGKELGAGIIGLNPLHALRNTSPYHISPYAPYNRLYLNELYIDLERLPEFYSSEKAQQLFHAPEFQAKLQALRVSRKVDYDAIATAKRAMLDLTYRAFLAEAYGGEEPKLQPKTARAWLFERFIQAEGSPLEVYATFQTLEEERWLIQSKSATWHNWPKQFQTPGQPVREYAKRHSKRVRFFQYVQWVASGQLNEIRRAAERLAMPIGLYHDVALGADRNGAEAWIYQSVLALGADCGAPPDAFAPEGQNWGLPPINPHALRASGYELMIQLLRNNFRSGGAIRLDHVMAFFRLFWIPRGRPASEGTYVRYPFEDLLAIVALESTRSKTLVIGEDLGTVPDWIREQLAQARVLSYRVFYFERGADGAMKPPGDYPTRSLAVATTHDLPTLAGFWSGEDLHVRSGLGAFPDDAARHRAWEERHRDKVNILSALKRENLLPPGVTEDLATVPAMTTELCQAIHLYLARTPSCIVLANFEDGLGELSQTNLPGTIDSHPNWTRKYAVRVDEMFCDERLRQLGAVLRLTRPLG
ncbi:MAG TPA: 4-alpha-glucanotransferase [Nitrospiraceae bacterium]|nr:4-alpha-glucanotransferase [Nitrospiraceae bacterium]